MRDESEAQGMPSASGDGPDTGEAERRRAFRRKLPFGRGAVLMVGERAHIVGLADVSVTGAFLSTRAPIAVGQTHVLKLLLLPERVEVAVPAEVVRVAQAANESDDHPRGVAVRFGEMSDRDLRSLEVYIAREPRRRPA